MGGVEVEVGVRVVEGSGVEVEVGVGVVKGMGGVDVEVGVGVSWVSGSGGLMSGVRSLAVSFVIICSNSRIHVR